MKRQTLKLVFQCGLALGCLFGFVLTILPSDYVMINIIGLIIMCGFAVMFLVSDYITK